MGRERGGDHAFPMNFLSCIFDTLYTGNRSFNGFFKTNNCKFPDVLSLLNCGSTVNYKLVAVKLPFC